MPFKGKKNSYQCEVCNGVIVTVDIDDGTTPFLLLCRATPSCDGMMKSNFYRIDQSIKAGYEWFRPASSKGYSAGMRQHIEMGGLVLRKIAPPPERAAPVDPAPEESETR
jgi:hypothetical protein